MKESKKRDRLDEFIKNYWPGLAFAWEYLEEGSVRNPILSVNELIHRDKLHLAADIINLHFRVRRLEHELSDLRATLLPKQK